ncbi:MAG: alpha/beta hydrolase [Deltaproteobacteria bacterium]|nr:alpha/beta hydrolase [Deltaproteobacteria bacterium]
MTAAARTGRAIVSSGPQPIEIAYDVFGDRGRPLVLIMGIGAQRLFWDQGLCELFVDAGFHVVRFDHRDIGESTRLDAPVPRPVSTMVRRFLGAPVTAPYTLSDMASDVAGLIEQLGFGSAHVVGASLGGMVGQHLAIEHSDRVRSLTSIMSTPGGRRYLPEPHALRALFMPRPTNAVEAGLSVERLFSTIGSPAWPVDGPRLRAIGEAAHARGQSPRGYLRHFAAVLATPDRRPKLRELNVPTLVIHGSRDPLFPLRAARDMVRMMPDATLLPIAGMGHDLPEPLWPTIVAAIARHAERADARATV